MQPNQTDTLDFSKLDTVLADAYANSPNHKAVVMYTFGRIPSWASNSSDTICAYANGQCYPPSDIKVDGSGTDALWRAFIVSLANHLNSLQQNNPNLYAPVEYFETWNEIDRSNVLTGNHATSNVSYNGTYAQLLRMTEDMRCILLGKNAQPTIHGNGQSCTYSGGLMPGVKIVAPSSHAQGSNYQASTAIEQNFLHCDVTGTHAPPAASYCTWSLTNPWGSNAVDIINFHMKPGNESSSSTHTDPEDEMTTEYAHATAVYKNPDQGKPLWNGESGYSGAGWTPAVGDDVDLTPYPDQQAAFIARYFLIQWSLGIQSNSWYQWDNSNFLNSTKVGTNGSYTDPASAYSTVAKWMVGNTMSSPCAVVSGTLWACTFTNGTWTGKIFWDTSTNHNCHLQGGGCSTYSYNVGGSGWTKYQTALGDEGSVSGPNFTIQVSNLPVMIMNGNIP